MGREKTAATPIRKPDWLKRRLPSGPVFGDTRRLVDTNRLHTVCQEARCPNQWECFSRRTATFLILGSRCTRACRFCAVAHGPVGPPDPEEPNRVARAAREMGLAYVVVTSVTRDDLPDGGASVFVETIHALREALPSAGIEVLVPDFNGSARAASAVIDAGPDVLNHNLETVPRLYPTVRPGADYRRSLALLRAAAAADKPPLTKSGLMLGLGEQEEEIKETLADLLDAECRILTLGQYLQPSPEAFERWGGIARSMGFSDVASGPLVRSSYQAGDLYQACRCGPTPS
ncbi:MAG: lipoyl synthase [Desulfobacterales bacterium]